MLLLPPTDVPGSIPTVGRVRSSYGAGGSEPYARALRGETSGLTLHGTGPGSTGSGRVVPLARFARPADAVDQTILDRARGAVLDVGCGPGRMVAAALGRRLPALGVDVAAAAVRLARRASLPVRHCSVFDLTPASGRFATVLLLDGNIGIGGDPAALLAQCAALLDDGGNLVVEVDQESDAERGYTGVIADDDGRTSGPFPWAELGRHALERHSARLALRTVDVWSHSDRVLVELERA